MLLCTECETDNSPDATVCTYCGASLVDQETESDGGGSQNSELAAEIARMLTDGKKIYAIKRYREATGCDLVEAKKAIEALQKEHGIAKGGCAGAVLLVITLAGFLVAILF